MNKISKYIIAFASVVIPSVAVGVTVNVCTNNNLHNKQNVSRFSLSQAYDLAKPGDLIYEGQGGFATFVGHIVTVTGTEIIDGVKNIDIIEATHIDVHYSTLTESDFCNKHSYLLQTDLTDQQRDDVVYFNEQQLGKPYSYDYLKYSTDISTKSWYCSELGWASYFYAGLNLWNGDDLLVNKGVTNYSLTELESLIAPAPSAIVNSSNLNIVYSYNNLSL